MAARSASVANQRHPSRPSRLEEIIKGRQKIKFRAAESVVPVGTKGKAISLRVWSLPAQAVKVVKQIETPYLPDPIMRRPGQILQASTAERSV
jgi:hypothetical protein